MRTKRDDTPKMEISEIREIIKLMKEHDLSEFELEREGIKLKLKKGIDLDALQAAAAAAAPKALPQPAALPESAPAPAPAVSNTEDITSPMVGTFYRSASPESGVFVKIGDIVDPDTTVCIIEAMKVMNEIKADVKGRIERVLIDDATPVQYGEPLFVVSPV
jgi:acetyl-CoA carboxylase biotin carboxyl carrier protein